MHPLIARIVATGFGSGYLPWAPGSWGSLVVLVPAWWLLELPIGWYLGIVAVFFFLGVAAVPSTDEYLHAQGGSAHDNKKIVIDEFVGMLLTLIPLFYFEKSIWHFGLAFIIFRLFDTLKFGLARMADRWQSHWGVMVDDLFAGLHAGIFFFVALWVMYS